MSRTTNSPLVVASEHRAHAPAQLVTIHSYGHRYNLTPPAAEGILLAAEASVILALPVGMRTGAAVLHSATLMHCSSAVQCALQLSILQSLLRIQARVLSCRCPTTSTCPWLNR